MTSAESRAGNPSAWPSPLGAQDRPSTPTNNTPFNAGEHYRKGRRDARVLIAAKGLAAAQRAVRDLARHESDLPRAWKHEFWGFRSIVTEHEED